MIPKTMWRFLQTPLITPPIEYFQMFLKSVFTHKFKRIIKALNFKVIALERFHHQKYQFSLLEQKTNSHFFCNLVNIRLHTPITVKLVFSTIFSIFVERQAPKVVKVFPGAFIFSRSLGFHVSMTFCGFIHIKLASKKSITH